MEDVIEIVISVTIPIVMALVARFATSAVLRSMRGGGVGHLGRILVVETHSKIPNNKINQQVIDGLDRHLVGNLALLFRPTALILCFAIGLGSLLFGFYKVTSFIHYRNVPPVPSLPDFDSGWVSGGHSPAEFCGPIEQMYADQYPDYNIKVSFLPEDVRKDFFGHVTYKYKCTFLAQLRR